MFHYRNACGARGVRLGLALAIAGWLGLGAAAAHAQPAGDAAAEAGAGSATAVGELMVTATRREEDIRHVAAAVSAVTGADIQAAGPVLTTGDVLQSIPGVRFNNLQSPVLGEISIRGSGTERASGAESGVGLFVDGAYIGGGQIAGRNFTNLDYFDLDRVEVLEGPQGALYGRDAEYGVINMVQAKPGFDESGYVDDAYTFQLRSNVLQAVVNHQVNDDWAIRFGVEDYAQTGGYEYNPDFNKYYDSTNGWLARFQVRFRHGPLDVDLLIDAQDLNLPEFEAPYIIPGGGKFPNIPQGFTQSQFNDPHGTTDSLEEKVYNAILTVNWDLGWATLTSVSMARARDTTLLFSTSYIDLAQEAQFQALGETGIWPFGHFYQNDEDNQFYEDAHLTGQAFDNRLNWLAGGELLHMKDGLTSNQITNPCTLKLGAGICAGTPTQHLCYLVLPTSTPCPATFPLPFGTSILTGQTYDSQSIYGSLSYKFDFGVTLDGELRYANDDKNGTRNVFALFTNNPFTFGTGGTITNPTLFKFSAGQTTYSVTASYAIPGDWNDLLYAKVGSGYRAGGFNFGNSPPGVAPNPLVPSYGDEVTTSYEGGLKGNVTRYAYFKIDGYESDTDNAIAITNDGCTAQNACGQLATPFNINGGTVHAWGFEGEVDFNFPLAGGDVALQLNGSTQDAHYVSVAKVAGAPILGSEVAQIPHWIASSTFRYTHPIAADWDGFFNLVYHGQWGGVQDNITATAPINPLHDFNNLDLRAGVDHHPFELALFVQNLTNTSYVVFQANNPTSGAPGVAAVPLQVRLNEPRTIGVEAKYKW